MSMAAQQTWHIYFIHIGSKRTLGGKGKEGDETKIKRADFVEDLSSHPPPPPQASTTQTLPLTGTFTLPPNSGNPFTLTPSLNNKQ